MLSKYPHPPIPPAQIADRRADSYRVVSMAQRLLNRWHRTTQRDTALATIHMTHLPMWMHHPGEECVLAYGVRQWKKNAAAMRLWQNKLAGADKYRRRRVLHACGYPLRTPRHGGKRERPGNDGNHRRLFREQDLHAHRCVDQAGARGVP